MKLLFDNPSTRVRKDGLWVVYNDRGMLVTTVDREYDAHVVVENLKNAYPANPLKFYVAKATEVVIVDEEE